MLVRLLAFLYVTGCTPPSAVSGKEETEDSGTPATDECDEHSGEVICLEGVAITCDAKGDISRERWCDPASTICIDGTGCTDCAIDLTVVNAQPGVRAFVPIRPPATADTFAWQRFHMRPVRITADPALTTGKVTLELSGTGMNLWSPDGEPLGTSTTVRAADLPQRILVEATSPSETSISASYRDCSSATQTVEFWSGTQPPITGYPLTDYPYFERVQVFNSNEVIRTAIDPYRHADRHGLPYTVYIVDHKRPEEWAADPSLIDISLGAAETATVTDTSVADNVVDAWTSDVPIPSGLTRTFDVVFDFDDNLTLDPGDIAIGPGDADPGLTAVGDMAATGPSSVQLFGQSTGMWTTQRVYYPIDLAEIGPVPLVVISHGNGHHYTWYDYLGYHLASWGYVVMSHTNNTGPGIETASTTTLTNTDAFLQLMDTAEGGALSGNIDASRIVWIGHSRGGEGVVRAYDRIVDEGYATAEYSADDIVLISSIAPTLFYSVDQSDPHDRPYHLFAGAADGDVHGSPTSQYVQYFRILSAADSSSQMTYLQGVGHNEFNCCGFADATGPALIGRTETQVVSKSYYLALIRAYADGDKSMFDYLSRRADVFRPQGISDPVVIANTYRPDPSTALRVIDDFQSEHNLERSAAGDSVIIDADEAYENILADGDGTLNWNPSDLMNGMTQAGYSGDTNRGLVVHWEPETEGSITWLIPDSMADFSPYTFLSFRAAQITRHPLTMGLATSLSVIVEVVDQAGRTRAIPHKEIGQVTHPYPRSTGGEYGWSNEFNTIRLRLTDFLADGSGLDLTDISAVRLRFGESSSSPIGAIGIDDLVLEY